MTRRLGPASVKRGSSHGGRPIPHWTTLVPLAPSQSPRSCRSEILVEHSAKPVATLHAPGRERDYFGRLAGSALLQPLMRSGVVVVLDEPDLPRGLLWVSAWAVGSGRGGALPGEVLEDGLGGGHRHQGILRHDPA